MRTGENIYKRKDGRWEARYRKGRKDNGKIIYGFCYGKTYSEAKSKMETARKCLPTISLVGKHKAPTVGSICDDWIRINRIRLKESTCVKYQTSIDKYIRPFFGDIPVSDITSDTDF